MTNWILALGVWLLGTGLALPAQAFDLQKTENLRYGVYWGPLKAGNAQLEYTPGAAGAGGQPYGLSARVWDSSVLIDFDDVWQVEGRHEAAALFVPSTYQAQQRENDYRADKLVTFDPARKVITYLNRRDPYDKEADIVWKNGMRDSLSAVYAWRVGGLPEIKRGGATEVMGLKRPFTLTKAAGVRESYVHNGKKIAVWRVNMTTATNGKPGKEKWVIKLRDDATLAPVEITAVTKFGTFNAILEE